MATVLMGAAAPTGSWYARTFHMRRVAEPPFERGSFWASVTFPVR